MTCLSLLTDEPLLLASVQSELLLLSVHSGALRLLLTTRRPVFSLDYYWEQQRVYWLSPDYQSIHWTDTKIPDSKQTLIKGQPCVVNAVILPSACVRVCGHGDTHYIYTFLIVSALLSKG